MLASDKFWELVDQFLEVIQAETGFPVLIFDTTGYIIRATDQSRIGQPHSGAEKIMHALADEYAVTSEEAAGNPLVQEGYSCPIIIEGEIVAGFGITGELSLARPMAKIAVKMIDAWIHNLNYQKQLENSEYKYRNIFDHSLHGIFQATMEGQFLTVNKAMAGILGYPSADALMTDIADIAHQLYAVPEDRTRLLEVLAQDHQVTGFVTQFRRRDGRAIDVSFNARLVRYSDTGQPHIEGILEDITEKKRAEAAIRLSEEKYFKAFNNSPVWVVISALDSGRYIEVNETFLRAMGYLRQDIIGRTAEDIASWVDPQDRMDIIRTIHDQGSVRNHEVQRRTRNGRVLTMLFSADTIHIADETCLLSVSQDISARKQMEENLRQSENRLKATLQSIGDAVITTDTRGTITRMNPMAEQLTGWSADEANGKPLPEVFHIVNAHTNEPDLDLVDRILARGKALDLSDHAILISRDGSEYQIAESGAPICDVDAPADGVVLVFRDVTEARTQARRIIESERVLKSITKHIPGVVFQFHSTADHQYAVRYTSENMGRYFGIDLPPEEVFDTFYACIPDSEKAGFLSSIRDCVDQARPWHYEGGFMKTGGEVMWFTGSAIPRQVHNGLMYYGVLMDVSERKQWEQSLAASERRYKELFNEAPVMYVITENRVNAPYIKNANALFLEILGYDRGEVIGTPLANYYTADSREALLAGGGYQDALTGSFSAAERKLVTKGGRLVHTLLHAQPEYGDDGRVLGTRAMFLDISARKHAEQEALRLETALAQAQKMEAIGTLAGGIAHDFNNILSAVIGYSQLSLKEMQQGSRLHHNLEQILVAGMRARDLVSQILTFSRQQERQLVPLQVGRLAREALKLLRATLPATIHFVQEIDTDIDNVMADPTQVQQIIMNLSTNAAQAMEEKGGQLTVRVSQVDLDPGEASRLTGLNPGPHVTICIQDTGNGISDEVLNHIFDPYFTTKERGKGTGLGLSVVHGIVKSIGGAIDVRSRPEHGSTFTVYIPAIERQGLDEEVKPEALPTGSGCILLVDDEPLLIEIGQQTLELLGYEVITCHSGLTALDRFKRAPEDIDLVISDVTMPDMTGDVLAREMLNIRKDLPIILTTGFSGKLSQEQVTRIGVKGYLMKPVIAEDLANMVHDILTRD